MYTLTNIMCHISASMKTRADDLSELGHKFKHVYLFSSVAVSKRLCRAETSVVHILSLLHLLIKVCFITPNKNPKTTVLRENIDIDVQRIYL